MYACDNCGGLFATPDTYTDCLTMDPPTYERRSKSPCCGTGYEKVRECPVCREYTKTERFGGLCDSCAYWTADGLRDFLNRFDKAQLHWLDHLLDGVSLEEFRDGK